MISIARCMKLMHQTEGFAVVFSLTVDPTRYAYLTSLVPLPPLTRAEDTMSVRAWLQKYGAMHENYVLRILRGDGSIAPPWQALRDVRASYSTEDLLASVASQMSYIAEVERFDVLFCRLNPDSTAPNKRILERLDQRVIAARGLKRWGETQTVRHWARTRFQRLYPGYLPRVLLGDGLEAEGNMPLQEVRASYAGLP